jgi:hypothetical protein
MGTTSVVEAARRALGPVGVMLPVSMSSVPSVELQREAVRRSESAGYRAASLPCRPMQPTTPCFCFSRTVTVLRSRRTSAGDDVTRALGSRPRRRTHR